MMISNILLKNLIKKFRALKTKYADPYEYMNSFERFNKLKNCLLKNVFSDLWKLEQLMIMVKNPGLSWDAILKMTGIKLEKLSDIDITYLLKKD